MTLLVAVPIGLAIGLLLGALGGGGSILAVPALVYLLGQSPHAATTGALAVVGISALTAMIAHLRQGRVRIAQGVVFGVLGVTGSYLGARASARVDPDVLLIGFAGLMVVAAIAMLRGRRPAPAPVAPPGSPPATTGDVLTRERLTTVPTPVRSAPAVSRAVKVVLAASAVGLITGFFGVGGGFVIVPVLILALGFDVPTAVGTSLLVIAINAGTALTVRLGGPTPLNWSLLAVFAAAAVAGSLAGHKITTLVRPRSLAIAFAVVCLFLAAAITANSIPHLLVT